MSCAWSWKTPEKNCGKRKYKVEILAEIALCTPDSRSMWLALCFTTNSNLESYINLTAIFYEK